MRTIQDLHQMQGLPLSVKIKMTKQRIKDWINEFGEDGVYISFSGGKDSTVLLHLVRQEYPNVKAMFVDTGLEYPEIRQFVKTFDNVDWLKPKKKFRNVIQDYGYPFISKEVSERVYYAQRYLRWWAEQHSHNQLPEGKPPTDYFLKDLLGLRRYPGEPKRQSPPPAQYGILELLGAVSHEGGAEQRKLAEITDEVIMEFIETNGRGSCKLKELYGQLEQKNGKKSMFNYSKWKWLATSPYRFSNWCCGVMKKAPARQYSKDTGRVAMTAMMASESRLRSLQWLKVGCNSFDAKKPVSNPMAFWTEQDVLLYVYSEKIPICSVYGDIVADTEVEGQLSFGDVWGKELFDLGRPSLETTGCNRTGCVFCGFGCHLEKPGNGRFERLKVTHPKLYDYVMRPWEEEVEIVNPKTGKVTKVKRTGLNYKAVIDWLNENGNLNIRY